MTVETEAIRALESVIASRIWIIRDERVNLDVHLAELYGVETRVLK